jgi:hypothetical protein
MHLNVPVFTLQSSSASAASRQLDGLTSQENSGLQWPHPRESTFAQNAWHSLVSVKNSRGVISLTPPYLLQNVSHCGSGEVATVVDIPPTHVHQ